MRQIRLAIALGSFLLGATVLAGGRFADLITVLDVAGSKSATLRTDLPKDAADEPPLGVVVDDGVPF